MSILAGKTVWLVGLMLLCVGLVVGLGLDSTVEDADAAKKKELKTLWAVVDEDGNIARSHGNAESIFTGVTGVYQIRFNRDVSTCAVQCTLSTFGEIYAFQFGPGTDILVNTSESDGTAADKGFNRLVNC